jgi:hypothetical protein
MKLHLFTFLLAIAANASATAPDAAPREWKPATSGVEFSNMKPDASGVLEIRAGDNAVVPVLRDTAPGLKQSLYLVRGEVKHENVGGTGYLEMWNFFAPAKGEKEEQGFFTRTIGESGPMQKLQGNSAWREFILPFQPGGASGPPVRLELNVVLPDGGTVWLRNVRLTQPAGAAAWWKNNSAAGIAGGALGSIVGILGAIVGSCAQRGKGRAIAQAALSTILIIGIGCSILFVWAASGRHWEWMTSSGVIALVVFVVLPKLRARITERFDDIELRRMNAADA